MKKFRCLLIFALILALTAGTLAACGEKPGESSEESVPVPVSYDCETAWEASRNMKAGWNLGLSLSPYSTTSPDSFSCLIGSADTAEIYNRSPYTNYFDNETKEVEIEWSVEDEEGLVMMYEDAEFDKFHVEVWNFGLGEKDALTVDIKEFYYVKKDGTKVELNAAMGEQRDDFGTAGGTKSAGVTVFAMNDLDPDVKMAEVASVYLKMGFVKLESIGETTKEDIERIETCWGNPLTTAEMINAVAEKGFNVIRPQVSWINHMDEEGNIDPLWMDRVNEVVDYCMDAGMYCLINTTGAGWMSADPETYEAQSRIYKRLWEQIAERFKDYDEKLIFESCNEVEYKGITTYPPVECYGVMNKFYQDFVDTVRAGGGYNKTRNLCLNTYFARYEYDMNQYFELPKDTVEGHLMAQVHCYEWGDSMVNAEWGSDADRAFIDNIMRGIRQRFITELNVPVTIGEFGVTDEHGDAKIAQYVDYFVKAAQGRGINYIYFDDGNIFTLLNRNTLEWVAPKTVEALLREYPLLENDEPYQPPKTYEECETAKEAVDNIKVGWNLGLSLSYFNKTTPNYTVSQYETAWGKVASSQEMIDFVADRGFNIIRPQVSWYNHMDAEGNVDPEWMERVAEVVDYHMNAGIYCIINTTGACWLTTDPDHFEQNCRIYKNLWTQIATRFKDYGELLIFESCNEVLKAEGNWSAPGPEEWDNMNALYQIFVDTVRATGGYNATRNLCLNTYGAMASYEVNSDFELPKDTVEGHLLAQVHCYEPNNFCFNETNLGSTNFTNDWGTAEEKARIDTIMAGTAERFIKELGIPVIIGEFGVVERPGEEKRAEYVSYFINSAQSRGIKCIYFDDAWDFSILDRKELKWIAPKVVDALFQDTPLLQGEDPYSPNAMPGRFNMEGWYSARLFCFGPAWQTSDWYQYDSIKQVNDLEWDLDGTEIEDLCVEINNDPSVTGPYRFVVTLATYTDPDGKVTSLTEALGGRTVELSPESRFFEILKLDKIYDEGIFRVKFTVLSDISGDADPAPEKIPESGGQTEGGLDPAAVGKGEYLNADGWRAVIGFTDTSWQYSRCEDVNFDKNKQVTIEWDFTKNSENPYYQGSPDKDIDGWILEVWNFPLGERVKAEKLKIKFIYRIDTLEYTMTDGKTYSCGLDGKEIKLKLSNIGTAGGSVWSFEGEKPLQKDIASVKAVLTLVSEYE